MENYERTNQSPKANNKYFRRKREIIIIKREIIHSFNKEISLLHLLLNMKERFVVDVVGEEKPTPGLSTQKSFPADFVVNSEEQRGNEPQ